MVTNEFDTYLPKVRCSIELRERLEEVTRRSITRNMADHIRFAVEQYVAGELPAGAIQAGLINRKETQDEPVPQE